MGTFFIIGFLFFFFFFGFFDFVWRLELLPRKVFGALMVEKQYIFIAYN